MGIYTINWTEPADHVLMDIEILNDTNKLQRPWLTIIIDNL